MSKSVKFYCPGSIFRQIFYHFHFGNKKHRIFAVQTVNMIQNIGEIIKFHRNSAGLSRIDLADIAGTGKTVIYDIEHGKNAVQFTTLLKVLKALNITISFNSPLMNDFRASLKTSNFFVGLQPENAHLLL